MLRNPSSSFPYPLLSLSLAVALVAVFGGVVSGFAPGDAGRICTATPAATIPAIAQTGKTRTRLAPAEVATPAAVGKRGGPGLAASAGPMAVTYTRCAPAGSLGG